LQPARSRFLTRLFWPQVVRGSRHVLPVAADTHCARALPAGRWRTPVPVPPDAGTGRRHRYRADRSHPYGRVGICRGFRSACWRGMPRPRRRSGECDHVTRTGARDRPMTPRGVLRTDGRSKGSVACGIKRGRGRACLRRDFADCGLVQFARDRPGLRCGSTVPAAAGTGGADWARAPLERINSATSSRAASSPTRLVCAMPKQRWLARSGKARSVKIYLPGWTKVRYFHWAHFSAPRDCQHQLSPRRGQVSDDIVRSAFQRSVRALADLGRPRLVTPRGRMAFEGAAARWLRQQSMSCCDHHRTSPISALRSRQWFRRRTKVDMAIGFDNRPWRCWP